jgi:hypothetical protein
MRFIARTTGAYPGACTGNPSIACEGPPGHDLGLMNEGVIDTFLRTNKAIATADFTIDLEQ